MTATKRKKRTMTKNDVALYVNGESVPDVDLYRFCHAIVAVERAEIRLAKMAADLYGGRYA